MIDRLLTVVGRHYELLIMHYALRSMHYALCVTSICITYYALTITDYILCIMHYKLCILSCILAQLFNCLFFYLRDQGPPFGRADSLWLGT